MMSEISKSFKGSGIFLLFASVFSNPGNSVVLAICNDQRRVATYNHTALLGRGSAFSQDTVCIVIQRS